MITDEQSRFVRLYDETQDRSYHEFSPDGLDLGVKTNDGNKKASIAAWGSFKEIGDAVAISKGAKLGEVLRGSKVVNFYNNIIDPNNPDYVTIDTHAEAAALFFPANSSQYSSVMSRGQTDKWRNEYGITGTYFVFADAYKELAEELRKQESKAKPRLAKGGMSKPKKYNKGGYANCGASVSGTQGKK